MQIRITPFDSILVPDSKHLPHPEPPVKSHGVHGVIMNECSDQRIPGEEVGLQKRFDSEIAELVRGNDVFRKAPGVDVPQQADGGIVPGFSAVRVIPVELGDPDQRLPVRRKRTEIFQTADPFHINGQVLPRKRTEGGGRCQLELPHVRIDSQKKFLLGGKEEDPAPEGGQQHQQFFHGPFSSFSDRQYRESGRNPAFFHCNSEQPDCQEGECGETIRCLSIVENPSPGRPPGTGALDREICRCIFPGGNGKEKSV